MDINNWITNKCLNSKLELCLTDLGVENTDDLKYILETPDHLNIIKTKLTNSEYQQFIDESNLLTIKSLDDWTITSEPVSTISSVVNEQKLEETSNKLETLKALANNKDTEIRIKSMEEEIRKLQLANRSKDKEKKLSLKSTTERLTKTKNKKRLIDELECQLQIASSLDLAIMLDCTGSMNPYLDEVKSQIQEFIDSINKIYPDIMLRIAFVGYRDHWDGPNRLVIQPFTKNIIEFQNMVAKQGACGGNILTDTIGALNVVNSLEWSSSIRILYHIGDMPCRGREFHDITSDPYENGDPFGLIPITLLQGLHSKDVLYYFGKITGYTDKMITRFNELMQATYVKTTPMNSMTMMKVISASVTASLTASLSSSSRAEDGNLKLKDFTLSNEIPDWSVIPIENALAYSLTKPNGIISLIEGDNDTGTVESFPHTDLAEIQCATHPFAQGAIKMAYYGKHHAKAVILKESLAKGISHQSKKNYESYLSSHRVAMYLASQFNSIRPTNCDSISFSEINLLQFMARFGQPFFTEEEQIVGEWEKFNGNSGFCAPLTTPLGTKHEAIQTFSHWTHKITNDHLMVVDCQGAYSASNCTFHLTDPVIHCVTLLRFGGTNLGHRGFERFYKTHTCNGFCKDLGLT